MHSYVPRVIEQQLDGHHVGGVAHVYGYGSPHMLEHCDATSAKIRRILDVVVEQESVVEKFERGGRTGGLVGVTSSGAGG